MLTFLSDVFQPVAAYHTWVSLAITADDENCPWNTTEMGSERELWQLPLPEGETADGQAENVSDVDAVKWCERIGWSTVPVAAPFELLNFTSLRRNLACSS